MLTRRQTLSGFSWRSWVNSAFRASWPTTPYHLPDVSLTDNLILINGQFLQRHWASRMQAVGANTDLGSETEFCPIIKSGGCIPKHGRGIDLVEEFIRRLLITRDDGIAVVRTIGFNMADRIGKACHYPDGKNEIEVFGSPILFGGGTYSRPQNGLGFGVSTQLDPATL